MSVQSEITRISGNVSNAYAAVSEKGGTLPENQASGNLAEAIRSIPAGSTDGPLDPVQVYQDTRPAGWLPIPGLIKEDEMYILYHIPDGETVSAGFTVTCTGNYLVQLGTVVDGEFSEISSFSLESGAPFETEISSADFGEVTSDGFKQVMVKVSGTSIKTWEPVHNASIVEISCRLPSGEKVQCGNQSAGNALSDLRYFSWQGKNTLKYANYMFSRCNKLICVLSLSVSTVTTARYMFAYCGALSAIPPMSFESMTIAHYIFNSAVAIEDLSHVKMPNVSNIFGAFTNCHAKRPPDFAFSKITSILYAFAGCEELTEVLGLNTTSISTGCEAFTGCRKLKRFTLDPSIGTCNKMGIEITSAQMGRTAIVELFRSLPVSTEESALKLTGNPGVPELTDEDKAIAVGKNWALTL